MSAPKEEPYTPTTPDALMDLFFAKAGPDDIRRLARRLAKHDTGTRDIRKRILRALEMSETGNLTLTELIQRTQGVRPEVRRDALNDLVAEGQITLSEVQNGPGRPGSIYTLALRVTADDLRRVLRALRRVTMHDLLTGHFEGASRDWLGALVRELAASGEVETGVAIVRGTSTTVITATPAMLGRPVA